MKRKSISQEQASRLASVMTAAMEAVDRAYMLGLNEKLFGDTCLDIKDGTTQQKTQSSSMLESQTHTLAKS
jgi:hypothetical protein